MTYRSFAIRFGEKSLRLSTFFTPEGKIAQYSCTRPNRSRLPGLPALRILVVGHV